MYDIRGRYPEEISGEDMYWVGRGFIRFLKSRMKKEKLSVCASRDERSSSPELLSRMVEGMLEEGANVVDLGVVTTPQLAFAVFEFQYDGGAVVTASHNPNPYNGAKFLIEKGVPVSGTSGLFEIRDWVRSSQAKSPGPGPRGGSVSEKETETEYSRFCFQAARLEPGFAQGLKVAVDAGNGIGGSMIARLLKDAGAKLLPLYMDPDGRFPNHEPNPLLDETLDDIEALVRKEKADLGVALDGDADRVRFIDEKGNPMRGDIATAFLSEVVLSHQKGPVVYDIRSSNAVPEAIALAGGKPIPSRIGHAFIKERMKDEGAVFAGELAGHYYLGKPYFFDAPFVFVLLALSAVARGQKLSVPSERLNRYSYSGELNFEVVDKEGKVAELKAKYAPEGTVNEMDGLRMDFEKWWFLVRPSNTENFLRLVVEADDEETLREKVAELSSSIR